MRLFRLHSLTAAVIAAVLPLTASGLARGEYFEYSATVSISGVTGLSIDSGNGTNDVELNTTAGPNTVPVSLTTAGSNNAPTGHLDATAPNGTDITFGYLTVKPDSNSTASGPVSFDFEYTLTVTDFDSPVGGSSNGTAQVKLGGTLSGTIGAGRAVNLNNLTSYGPASQVVLIGSTWYNITTSPNAFRPPGPYSPPVGTQPATGLGSLGAHFVAVPEPGSVALLSIGGGLFFAGLMRKRLRQSVDSAA